MKKIEQRLEFQHREFFKQVIDRKPLKSSTEATSNFQIKDENISLMG